LAHQCLNDKLQQPLNSKSHLDEMGERNVKLLKENKGLFDGYTNIIILFLFHCIICPFRSTTEKMVITSSEWTVFKNSY
jgi:hypothetical protein